MNNPNPPTPLTTISAPATPELLYPWPKAALDIGLPWVWPHEIAKDLNKLEPFIAARVAESLTTAQHEHAANETTGLIAARREGRLEHEALVERTPKPRAQVLPGWSCARGKAAPVFR